MTAMQKFSVPFSLTAITHGSLKLIIWKFAWR